MNGLNHNGSARRAASLVGLLAMAGLMLWLTTDFDMVRAYRRLLTVTAPGTAGTPVTAVASRFPAAQRLVLEGDLTRSSRPDQQRALWEAAPTNTARFHHYLTCLLVNYDALGTNAEQRYARLTSDLRKGRDLDWENARFDFVLAAKLLEQAVETKTAVTGVTDDGKARVRSEQVVKNRAKLEESMRLLERGLLKPVYRRYTGDVLGERLAILGEPHTLSDQILRLGLASDTSMPDLALMRNLSRGAAVYAALLVGEGKMAQAEPFLGAWKPLTLALTRDSFALIDVLMAAAMVKEAELRIPDLYRQAGHAEEADKMLKETRAMAAPLQTWNARRMAFEHDPAARREYAAFSEHTGILASMLLPALTELPSAAELAPSRALDYVLIEDLFFSLSSLLMFAVMLGWTTRLLLTRSGEAGADRVSEGRLWLGAAGQALGGVALPVAAYFLVTRLLPLAGRFYGLPFVWPKAVVEIEALGLSMILLGCLTAPRPRSAVDGNPGGWRRILYAGMLVVVVGLAVFVPVSVLNARNERASLVAMAVPLLMLLGVVLVRVLETWPASSRSLTVRRDSGARLVLTLGLGILVLTVGARGHLRAEEARWVRQETVLKVAPAEGGFTVAEGRLTRALRDLVLDAAKE